MEQVFESDNIQFAKVNESLVRDYLTMINDIEHVVRFISKRIKPFSEETEADWVCRKLGENARYLFDDRKVKRRIYRKY